MRRTVICAAVLAAALLTVPAAALAANSTIIIGPQKILTPPDQEIAPGETVTWQYAPNSINHHIMSNTQGTVNSWDFGEHFSGTFPRVFANTGSFAYHCALHPQEMHGTITVDRPTLSMAAPTPAGDKFPNDVVSFSATAGGTNGATITDYQWDYDGDGTFDETTTDPSASHAYTDAGTFQAKVRVTQSNGKTNDAIQPVVIFSRTPTASFTATPATVDKNATVTLDAGGSVDHDGSIATYEWDVGAGFEAPSVTSTRTVSWATAGTKTVKLRVTDNDGNASETTRTVTVSNHLPTAGLTSSTTSLPVGGGSVTLDATGSADTDGTVDGYAWDLDGNGTFETPGGTTPTVTTSVTRTGANTIRVRVTDNDGATGDASVVVNVASPPPPPPPASSTGGSTTTTTTTTAKPAASTTPAPIVAVKPPSVAAPAPVVAAAPLTATAPAGQKLKRQKGVRVSVACGAACKLVATGAVKVKGKRLRLARATAKLGSAGTATLTLKVDKRDLKALRKAKGKAQATITVQATTDASTVTQKVAISLIS